MLKLLLGHTAWDMRTVTGEVSRIQETSVCNADTLLVSVFLAVVLRGTHKTMKLHMEKTAFILQMNHFEIVIVFVPNER